MRASLVPIVLALAMPVSAQAGAHQVRPVAVSPSSEVGFALVEGRCPTFSWSGVPGARFYEVNVYDLDGEARPVLEKRIPGAALSWTPTLGRCLEPGRRYAWSVRAVGARWATRWSLPSLFQAGDLVEWSNVQDIVLSTMERYLERREGAKVPAEIVLGTDPFRSPRPAEPSSVARARATAVIGTAAIQADLPVPGMPQLGFGVRGIVAHEFEGSSGVLGESLAEGAGGAVHGVRGITHGSAAGASGVRGESSAAGTYGVLGVTTSSDADSAGVRGEGATGVVGVGETEAGQGVVGIVKNVGARALVGRFNDSEVFSVDGSGHVEGASFSGDGSGLTALAADTAADLSCVGCVGGTELASTLTLADGDLLDLSSINGSSTAEGLILPSATDVTAATGEGQITWDSDDDTLYVGDGTSATAVTDGLTITTDRTSTSGSVPPFSDHSVDSPTCSAGWIMISGGCEITDADNESMWLLAGYPDTAAGRWTCTIRNRSSVTTATWEAFILCASIDS